MASVKTDQAQSQPFICDDVSPLTIYCVLMLMLLHHLPVYLQSIVSFAFLQYSLFFYYYYYYFAYPSAYPFFKTKTKTEKNKKQKKKEQNAKRTRWLKRTRRLRHDERSGRQMARDHRALERQKKKNKAKDEEKAIDFICKRPFFFSLWKYFIASRWFYDF